MADSNEHQSDNKHIPEAYLSTVLGKLFATPNFSDFKFLCAGQEIEVHKAIVCTQSPVIDKAVTNEFFVEAHNGTINMDYFDLPTVRCMVEFMYTGKYYISTDEIGFDTSKAALLAESEEAGLKPASEKTEYTTNLEILKSHVRVNAIAEYYDVPRLRDIANYKIEEIFAKIGLSTNVFLGVLKETQEITGDNGLYQILASAAARHLEGLLVDEGFGELDIMKDEFGRNLLVQCAQLITATTDCLKAKQELYQQVKSDLTKLQKKRKGKTTQ